MQSFDIRIDVEGNVGVKESYTSAWNGEGYYIRCCFGLLHDGTVAKGYTLRNGVLTPLDVIITDEVSSKRFADSHSAVYTRLNDGVLMAKCKLEYVGGVVRREESSVKLFVPQGVRGGVLECVPAIPGDGKVGFAVAQKVFDLYCNTVFNTPLVETRERYNLFRAGGQI